MAGEPHEQRAACATCSQQKQRRLHHTAQHQTYHHWTHILHSTERQLFSRPKPQRDVAEVPSIQLRSRCAPAGHPLLRGVDVQPTTPGPLDSNGAFLSNHTAPHPVPHVLHQLHPTTRTPRDSTGAAEADTPSVAKSQAPPNTIYARTQQSKRAAASSSGGSGPVLPLVASAVAGGLPGAKHCGIRPGAHSRSAGGAGAHDPRLRSRLLQLMVRLVPWVTFALVGLVLLWVAAGAEGAPPARPTPYDVQLNLGPYFFNPSIVKHKGVYLSTARTAHMKRIEKTNW